MRSALLLLLGTTAWPLSADAQPVAAEPAQTPVPVPYVVSTPPPRPAPEPPQRVAAFQASLFAITLVSNGKLDEAVARFRQIDTDSARGDVQTYAAHARHLDTIVRALIRAGRLDLADRLMARFLARASPALLSDTSLSTQSLFDMRLYVGAARGDVAAVLRLLEARPTLEYGPRCWSASRQMFPQVLAPLQHDPQVAAKLRLLGCSEDLISRLDDLASRPIGDRPYDPGLPPRVPAR